MKISVIIPIFNVENYLNKCLDSILSQTLNDIEVICIDDYSNDNSFKIANEYAKRDERVRVFKNDKNIGQGLTRNLGIDLARGEYIAFVDSDDWIEPKMYESLYEAAANERYDLVCCNLSYDFSNGESKTPKMPNIDLISRDFLIEEAIASTIDFFSPNSPCDKIYRVKFIIDNNIKFLSERELLYEDKYFNIEVLVCNPSICFLPTVYYHYMVRNGSTMVSYRKKLIERFFLLDSKIRELLIEKSLMNDNSIARLSQSLFEQTFNFLLNALVFNNSKKGKIQDFFNILNDKRISSNLKKFKISDIPRSTSIKTRMVKIICFLIIKYIY